MSFEARFFYKFVFPSIDVINFALPEAAYNFKIKFSIFPQKACFELQTLKTQIFGFSLFTFIQRSHNLVQ